MSDCSLLFKAWLFLLLYHSWCTEHEEEEEDSVSFLFPWRASLKAHHRLILLPRTPSPRSRSSSPNNQVYCRVCSTTNLNVWRICHYICVSPTNYPKLNLTHFETSYTTPISHFHFWQNWEPYLVLPLQIATLMLSLLHPGKVSGKSREHLQVSSIMLSLLRSESAQDFFYTLAIWGSCCLPCGSFTLQMLSSVYIINLLPTFYSKKMIYESTMGLAWLFANKNNKGILRQWDVKLIHNHNESLFMKIYNLKFDTHNLLST